ncbi:MAG TPA: hypothetical protein VFY90_06570 [Tepidiformaceae bacterium]|nr:hypothetical protein [Tepidiformaceae bacterium]
MTTAERPAAAELGRGISTSYAGNADFHRGFCDLVDGAERDIVDYVIPETRPDEHDKFILRAYGNAVRRGVRCRTLISPEHLHLVQSTWDPNFDMRAFLQQLTHIRLVEKVSGPSPSWTAAKSCSTSPMPATAASTPHLLSSKTRSSLPT